MIFYIISYIHSCIHIYYMHACNFFVFHFPVRTIIDEFAKVPDTLAAQEKLCLECIEWCKQERRTYLRQRLQSKLAGM